MSDNINKVQISCPNCDVSYWVKWEDEDHEPTTCPFCGAEDTKVIDSRQVEAFQVKRRRSCGQCERRFTTIEARQLNMPKLVKSSGYLESFDEEKLRAVC